MMISSFIHVTTIYSTSYFTVEHLHCIHVLATVNSVAVNTGVHVSSWVGVFSRYMPRSGSALFSDNSGTRSIFSFLRNLQYFIVLCAFLSCEITSVFTHMKTSDVFHYEKIHQGSLFYMLCHFFLSCWSFF